MTEQSRFHWMNETVDESYQLLAARYLRKQTKHLVGQFDGIRGSVDIEFVHRGRVASRRLRAALRMFFDFSSADQIKRWRKEVRRLTDDLGGARDKDVQINFLIGELSEVREAASYPGIVRALADLEKRRRRLQPKVVAALDRFESSRTAKEVLATAKKTLSRVEKDRVSLADPYVLERTEAVIAAGLEEFLSQRACLEDSADGTGHHRMRITAKRLRYTMEICRPAHGDRLDPFIDAVKRLQTLLGGIHDCDVWRKYLNKLLERERKKIVKDYGHPSPLARLQVGIDYLQGNRAEAHKLSYRDLLRYWSELNEESIWDRLAETIESRPERPNEPTLSTVKAP